MPGSATNKSNLASVESAITTFEANAAQATGGDLVGVYKLARALRREIASYKRSIQGL